VKKFTYPLLMVSLGLAGCAQPSASSRAAAAAALAASDAHESLVEERKDEMMRDLATCESGGTGDAERPIYGGRGAYLGRFQFAPRTVVTYVEKRDGHQISLREAADLAHNYGQAAALAKFVIFEMDGINNWPLCSRKLGLAKQVAAIKAL
jgi:hypothetical protein